MTPGERGAALIVALIFLAALSALGIAGVGASITELSIARNLRGRVTATEAAASAIELALQSGPLPSDVPKSISYVPQDGSLSSATATIRFRGVTPVPASGFSIGIDADGVDAYHFEIRATGTAPRNATVEQRQGFYVLGPSR